MSVLTVEALERMDENAPPSAGTRFDAAGFRRLEVNTERIPSYREKTKMFSSNESRTSTAEFLDTVGSLPNFPAIHTPTNRQISPESPGVSPASTKSNASDRTFADPGQTLIIFDWDDTLFPTSELFDNWGFKSSRGEPAATKDDFEEWQWDLMQKWKVALVCYLQQACRLSTRCAIVTNSSRPWVEDCIERFIPELAPLFNSHNGPSVCYAAEYLKKSKRLSAQSMDLRPILHRVWDIEGRTREERQEELTQAKYAAMKKIAADFYSQYPGQSWKNILSLGDMKYEHDALQELTFRRQAPKKRERLRSKALILPTSPSLSEITLRLRFSNQLLPAYVAFNGDIDIDLRESDDPMEAIAHALSMPHLTQVPFPRHAWGISEAPQDESKLEKVLAEMRTVVNEWLWS